MINLVAALDELAEAIATNTGIPTFSDPDHVTPTVGLQAVVELTNVAWRRPTQCDSPATATVDVHLIATGHERTQVRHLIERLPAVADAVRLAGWAPDRAAAPAPVTDRTIPSYAITATRGLI